VAVHIDASEVGLLAVDMSRAPQRLQRQAPDKLGHSARNIRANMREDFSGHRYAPHIPNAVNYSRLGRLEYEIGVDKDGPQGGLGNILAYGTSNNAPVVDHTLSLHREVPSLERRLGEAAEDAVFGGPE
jgi:hypothetical protein